MLAGGFRQPLTPEFLNLCRLPKVLIPRCSQRAGAPSPAAEPSLVLLSLQTAKIASRNRKVTDFLNVRNPPIQGATPLATR